MIRLPGFIDLQVNGCLGLDFSSPAITPDAVRRVCDEMARRGVAAFLPTIITSSEERYARNLPILAGLVEDPRYRKMIPGLHVEGPFISREPGAVGAHNPAWTRLSDPAFLDKLMAWSSGTIRLLTVAAELPGVEALICHATNLGIVVSLGHQMAGPAELARAVRAGARLVTHFGNGMPNLVHRHDNVLWAALAEDGLDLCLVTDGHHLPPAVIKTALRAKGPGHCVVVSDASPAAGLPPGRYEVLGNPAVLEPSGKLYNPEKGCLVGSSANIVECANYLLAQGLASPGEVVALCLDQPLRLLGLQRSDLPADHGLVYDPVLNRFVTAS